MAPPQFRCPICGKPAVSMEDKAFPFCSIRCKQIDLGHWVEGDYNVARPLDPVTDIHDEPPMSESPHG